MTEAAIGDGWAVPAFPHEPREAPELTPVDDAVLTAVRRGELRTVQAPTRWLRGAVHDADGRLVPASQKIGGLGGNQAAMADPLKVPVPRQARRLGGTWLYGGHWIQHFGHFAIESVTTLWPDPAALADAGERVEGLVFHSYMSRFREIYPWQRELLSLTTWDGLPVEIVEDEPLRVDRLLVPGRSVVVNGWAHPPAAQVWDHMAAAAGSAAAAGGSGRRVFLTRTPFNRARREGGRPTRTDAARDDALDAVFAAAGFDVVAPETLPVREQLRLAADAAVLAGCAGSALHLSAFAPAGTRVIELGDVRSPGVQVPMQLVVDALRGHPSAFVPYDVAPADLPAVLDRLLPPTG